MISAEKITTEKKTEKMTSSAGAERLLECVLTSEVGGVRLEGGSGIGKTTLLFELYDRLRVYPGCLVGAARFEGAAEPPMLPVLAAVGELIGQGLQQTQLSTEQLLERMPPELGRIGRALARVLLALGASQGTGEAGSRWRMREASDAFELLMSTWRTHSALCDEVLGRFLVVAHRELTQRLGRLHLVLILDQLERAGRRSRHLVEVLAALPPGILTLVVGWNADANPLVFQTKSFEAHDDTAAPWEGVSPQTLRRSAGSAEGGLPTRLERLTRIDVTPWDASTLAAVYERLGGQPRRDPQALLELSGGSPLVLRLLMWSSRVPSPPNTATPDIPASQGASLEPSPSEHSLKPLLDLLAPPERALLGLLASMQLPFPVSRPELASLLKVEGSTVDPLIQRLRHQGVVGLFPRTLALVHSAVRAALHAWLPTAEQQDLNTRLMRFIETQHSRDLELRCELPYLVCFHQALEYLGDPRAFRCCAELCESFVSWGEWEVAAVYAARLERLRSTLEPAEQARLLTLRAQIAYELGELEQAIQWFEQAIHLHVSAGEFLLAQQLRLNLAATVMAAGALDEARSLLRDWLHQEVPGTEPLVWEAWQLLSQVETAADAIADAVLAGEQAIEAAEEHAPVRTQVKLRRELAELIMASGRIEAGQLHLQIGLELLRHDRTARAEVAEIAARLAVVFEFTGKMDQAEAQWRLALAEVEDDGQHEPLWCTLSGGLGAFLQRRGRTREALEQLSRALELAREAGLTALEARLLSEAALAYEGVGELGVALEYASQSMALRRVLGEPRALAVGANTLGTLLFAQSELEGAQTALEESLQLWRSLKDPSAESALLNNLGMLHEKRGHAEQAVACYEAALEARAQLHESDAVRHTLTNMVACLEGLQHYAGAERYMKNLVELDRQAHHPELSDAERFLRRLERRARSQGPAEMR